MTGKPQATEVKQAEPMLRANCSSVLRSRGLRAGDAQGGRSGAQRRPPARAGLSRRSRAKVEAFRLGRDFGATSRVLAFGLAFLFFSKPDDDTGPRRGEILGDGAV